MKRGKILIITGPSGVGKKSIWSEIVNNNKNEIVFSISMTTRKQRVGEVDGKDYFFVTREQFEKSISEDKMLEWAEFSGNLYGTPKDFVIDQIENGVNVLLEIEVQGVEQIIDKFKDNKDDLVTIFIAPPTIEILRERLLNRKTESQDDVNLRLNQAKIELKMANEFEHIIINDDLVKAKEQLKEIFRSNGI